MTSIPLLISWQPLMLIHGYLIITMIKLTVELLEVIYRQIKLNYHLFSTVIIYLLKLFDKGNRESGESQQIENRAVFSVFPSRLFGNGNIANPFNFNPRSLFGKSSTSAVFPYDSCSSPNGVMGICATAGICTQLSGTASGSCAFGSVCCIS